MSDRVKKLLLVSLSFGTTVVLIGLSAWWVPTLYDDKPTASFTWASEPEDTNGSTSGGSYTDGNGAPANNDSATESPGPVGSGDSGNQGGSGGSAGNGGSGNGEAGANGEQGGKGGSTNGPASGSGNKPGSSGGNVTSSRPGRPATSSGGGNSGTAGGGDGGPLTHEEKSWFHNDLTDEQNAVALECAKQLMGDYESKTPIATIKSVFLSMRGSGDKPHDNSPKYREAYDYACGHINEVTQIKMLGLVLDILGVEWEHFNEGMDNRHQWIYFYCDGARYYADFKLSGINSGKDPFEDILGY